MALNNKQVNHPSLRWLGKPTFELAEGLERVFVCAHMLVPCLPLHDSRVSFFHAHTHAHTFFFSVSNQCHDALHTKHQLKHQRGSSGYDETVTRQREAVFTLIWVFCWIMSARQWIAECMLYILIFTSNIMPKCLIFSFIQRKLPLKKWRYLLIQ